jgi:hypothetical protein
MKELWMTKQQAARACGVAPFKIDRLVDMKLLEIKRDPLDGRKRLVNVTALRAVLQDVLAGRR